MGIDRSTGTPLENPALMSKWQFWALNVIGGLTALLIVTNLFLAIGNNRLNREILEGQNQANRAQMVRNTFENLAQRINQFSDKEPALKALLQKHRLINQDASGSTNKTAAVRGSK